MNKWDSFYTNILKVFTGTIGAYGFWALAMLVVGRLYPPEYIGSGQLFVSAASIFAVVATGRYEVALTTPRFHFQAMQLFLFSAFLSLACTAGAFLFLLFFSDVIVGFVGISQETCFLTPVYMLELCFYVLAYGWMIRAKKYAVAAKGLAIFPLSYLAFCVVLLPMEMPIHKLAVAILLARAMEVLYYGYYFYGDIKGHIHRIVWQGVWRRGKEYIDFPKYMLLGSFVDMAAVHIVPFLITSFWGLEATGYYAMATQVLSAPVGLIAKSVGDVFRQEGNRLYWVYRECEALFLKSIRLCTAYSAVICICAYAFVPIAVSLFLGEKWNVAGQYVRWMLPMTFMTLIASPHSNMYVIARRQKDYLLIQALMLFSDMIGLGACGWLGKEIGTALLVWGAASMAVSGISIYGGWRIAKGADV